MKTAERLGARELRAAGWSIKEIERKLGVSRSSLSIWVRDVEVAPSTRIAQNIYGSIQQLAGFDRLEWLD